ncbi:4Fe-4S binding domain protein [Sphingobacterium spiritivorum ATCC 33300]|uniref:4Fe-4S binding domain protein n=1 Tax=Sphingobacterium spiritivorum ATCC 33300 TaxID=525372 RepID=C2G0H5_SPHSI|nr:4Fe-4S binding protein [Sphingobacterium spiritivorum]EEI91355.1 4Fe-4S binding domain protein [Sphingobacterium spiritivorum ATCC 33300]QQS97454.1 4Fe-4S binding protein [Sphingobacterium spiritivorum]
MSPYGTSNPDYLLDNISLNQEACDGLGYCLPACPMMSLSLVEGYVNGYFNSQTLFVDLGTCIICGLCAEVCPNQAIDVDVPGGGGSSTPGGTDNGGSGGGNASGSNFNALGPTNPINLEKDLDCFDKVPSNNNTVYKITIHVHSAHEGYPTQEYWQGDPGHAYITMEKSNNANVHRLSFGFYPKEDTWVTPTKNAVASGIGEESSNDLRRSDIRYTMIVNEQSFNNAKFSAIVNSNKPYDLNDFNCTDYAIEVFNAAMQNGEKLNVLNSNIGFTTPAGLYSNLDQLRQNGNTKISKSKFYLPFSNSCN